MTYIDTRDLYLELCELQETCSDLPATVRREMIASGAAGEAVLRLTQLEGLFAEIGEDAGIYGETMIPESDFQDYAQELAGDIGAIDPDAGWPATCIDWAQAARELAQDYTNVTFDGIDYLVRL